MFELPKNIPIRVIQKKSIRVTQKYLIALLKNISFEFPKKHSIQFTQNLHYGLLEEGFT